MEGEENSMEMEDEENSMEMEGEEIRWGWRATLFEGDGGQHCSTEMEGEEIRRRWRATLFGCKWSRSP